ncbi:hypothetical protein Agub_g11289, partial [Astrephomene gubernaculifera]
SCRPNEEPRLLPWSEALQEAGVPQAAAWPDMLLSTSGPLVLVTDVVHGPTITLCCPPGLRNLLNGGVVRLGARMAGGRSALGPVVLFPGVAVSPATATAEAGAAAAAEAAAVAAADQPGSLTPAEAPAATLRTAPSLPTAVPVTPRNETAPDLPARIAQATAFALGLLCASLHADARSASPSPAAHAAVHAEPGSNAIPVSPHGMQRQHPHRPSPHQQNHQQQQQQLSRSPRAVLSTSPLSALSPRGTASPMQAARVAREEFRARSPPCPFRFAVVDEEDEEDADAEEDDEVSAREDSEDAACKGGYRWSRGPGSSGAASSAEAALEPGHAPNVLSGAPAGAAANAAAGPAAAAGSPLPPNSKVLWSRSFSLEAPRGGLLHSCFLLAPELSAQLLVQLSAMPGGAAAVACASASASPAEKKSLLASLASSPLTPPLAQRLKQEAAREASGSVAVPEEGAAAQADTLAAHTSLAVALSAYLGPSRLSSMRRGSLQRHGVGSSGGGGGGGGDAHEVPAATAVGASELAAAAETGAEAGVGPAEGTERGAHKPEGGVEEAVVGGSRPMGRHEADVPVATSGATAAAERVEEG